MTDELLCSSSVQIAAPTSASRRGVLLMAMAELVAVMKVVTYAGTESPESSMALQSSSGFDGDGRAHARGDGGHCLCALCL